MSPEGKPSDIEIEEMDRISELPDFIIHHILSNLTSITLHTPPNVELVRMSVLSKKWFDVTASFPILEFVYYYFGSRESYFKYVEYATSRFCQQNLIAHKLTLITNLNEPGDVDVVNNCLELVLQKGVRELLICTMNSELAPYRLPNVLLNVSVLRSLSISGCELPSSLMVDVVQFKSLIQLTLEQVRIDDEVIKCFITSCPFLQELNIMSCHGFKNVCVLGHWNLQKVDLKGNPQVERIDIEAPNLSTLYITDRDPLISDFVSNLQPRMNVASCKKLTTVTYFGDPLPFEFLSNFPFIENLNLVTNCNYLQLASYSLRTAALESDCDLEDIEFRTPNLALFVYHYMSGLVSPILIRRRWPMLRGTTLLKGCMHFHPGSCMDIFWFEKLRQFLDKKNGFKVLNLYIHAKYSQEYTKLGDLYEIDLPPYELDHLELQLEIDAELSAHIAFVDAVLWCCRPRSLTLRSFCLWIDFDVQSDLVKFTCERLLQQEYQVPTEIQVVSPSSSEAQKHLMDLKSSSMALFPARKSISFIKEEVVTEEADIKSVRV